MSVMNRKGVELSWNVIIIAALSILVLLILAFVLMNGVGKWNEGTTCESKDGICTSAKTCPPDTDTNSAYIIPASWSCSKGQTCCVKVG